MEKIINIDGKDIRFKFNFTAFYYFKNQFGYDPMQKIMPVISELIKNLNDKALTSNELNLSEIGAMLEDVYHFEAIDVLNIIWAFAKCGDPNIKDPLNWYADFENFPIIDVIKELYPSFLESLATKKKSTNTKITMKK